MPKVVDVDERRIELARAAARVIARSGIAGASMREVAAEAGWTTGTLVHYFRDKSELLRFTLEVSLDQRRDRTDDRGHMNAVDALVDSLRGALPLDEESRLHWLVTVAFCAQAGGDAELARVQRDAYRDFRGRITDLLVASHQAEPADACKEAERLIAVADGVAMQALFDPESWPPARQLGALTAALPSLVLGAGEQR